MFWERILLAFLISASSFCFSYYWYKKGAPTVTEVERSKQVAKLVSLRNEVQRKPSKRVIWEHIVRDEALYSNEAIKTGPGAEAVIEFTEEGKRGTRIHLEPESVVVLEENDSDLTLDFLKGNVFVAGSGGDGLTIKAGDSTIAVGEGELSLNQEESGGVNLRVHRGLASVEADGKSVQLDENQSGSLSDKGLKTAQVDLKIVRPLTNRVLFLDLRAKEKMSVNWNGLPEGYQLRVLAGESRREMKEVEGVEVDYVAKTMQVPLPRGRVYWRLEAVSRENNSEILQSVVHKNKVVALLPPQILSPENGEQMVLEKGKSSVLFQVANPLKAKSLQLSLSRVLAEGKRTSPQVIPVGGNSLVWEVREPGAYLAQLTGQIEDGEGQLRRLNSGQVKFEVQWEQSLSPPAMISPAPGQRLAFNEHVNQGIYLTWKTQPAASSYLLKVEKVEEGKRKVMKKQIEGSSWWMERIEPGSFAWSVASVSSEGETSAWAPSRNFVIGKIPQIEWADGKERARSFYVGVDPYLDLEWKKTKLIEGQEVVKWRSKVGPQAEFSSIKKWVVMKSFPYRKKVKEDGRYLARVQAIGARGQVIGQTGFRLIEVLEKPLLPAPRFSQTIPAKLKATARGNLELRWSEVPGAVEYMVQLKDEKDRLVENFKVADENKTLRALRPGKYKVNVLALDADGRKGIEGESRAVWVENKSDVRAPAFKKVKVKAVGRGKK